MNKQKAKAEAEKIKEEIYEVVKSMTYYGKEAEIKSKVLAIIHVKGIMEVLHAGDVVTKAFWDSILTELENL